MTKNLIFQVDAFTGQLFKGNPAAVVPLESWLPDEVMQSIAAENNLSETAFFVKNGSTFGLRWFTPTIEVDFCGHATLATSHILFTEWGGTEATLEFNTRIGKLKVSQAGKNTYLMDFPADELSLMKASPELEKAIGIPALEAFSGREDIIYVVASQELVEQVSPDFRALGLVSGRGVLVTAAGKDCDFVSRCFFPNAGVDEDPVTGSAHTTLTPYWAKKLNKSKLTARQISKRGGFLECELSEDKKKVLITGMAVTYLKGEYYL
ncbi:MAG: PhzF family phenazine biosynthesis protein [Saprospiraceae bacterium]|nr:PhzF family phenazine biosynthesis protein [Saprospiraceae bacterium]MCB9326260.1 PhzF family phenazine biosynthesis protein [Lewinellaceae bacterium]